MKARAVETTEDQSKEPAAPMKRTRKVLNKKESTRESNRSKRQVKTRAVEATEGQSEDPLHPINGPEKS